MAGGQSSSRTPNEAPAGGFFSKGFLMRPGMPIFQLARSRGGLESSGVAGEHTTRVSPLRGPPSLPLYNTRCVSVPLTPSRSSVVPCFGGVGAVALALSLGAQEGLLEAEGLAGRLGGGLRSAAGCAATGVNQTSIRGTQWGSVSVEVRCWGWTLGGGGGFSVPHHGVVFLDLSADQVLACERRVLKRCSVINQTSRQCGRREAIRVTG